MGVTTDSSQRAFKEPDVVALYQRPRRTVLYNYRAVYIGVDPAGGGQSAFSICSLGRAMDGGVTVRFAFLFPQFLPKSQCERLRTLSNEHIRILCKVGEVHGHEEVQQQQCNTRRSDAAAQLSFFFNKVGGHFAFSVESQEQKCASADEAFGVGLHEGRLLDNVLDGVELWVSLIESDEQAFETREVLIQWTGGMS